MPLRKPLELSEILGVQVKCNACGKTESFPFPLDKPEKIGCPHVCSHNRSPGTLVVEPVWMEEAIKIAAGIENVRASERVPQRKFKLKFLLSDKP